MNIICASICYRGYAEDEVAATLENAPKIGYKFVELHGPMTWTIEAIEAFAVADMKTKLDAARVTCAGLYPPGWGGSDVDDVREHARAIARAVGITESLGGTHISTTGASQRGDEGALDRVIACARQVMNLVPTTTPIKMTLEPHYGNVLQQPEDFARVFESVDDPRLGLCIDTGHFHSAGVDAPDTIRRFASRVHAVHFKDHIGTASVGIGRGEIDLAAVVTALREIGYDGGLTVELEVPDPENLPKYTEEAFIYISGLLGSRL